MFNFSAKEESSWPSSSGVWSIGSSMTGPSTVTSPLFYSKADRHMWEIHRPTPVSHGSCWQGKGSLCHLQTAYSQIIAVSANRSAKGISTWPSRQAVQSIADTVTGPSTPTLAHLSFAPNSSWALESSDVCSSCHDAQAGWHEWKILSHYVSWHWN